MTLNNRLARLERRKHSPVDRMTDAEMREMIAEELRDLEERGRLTAADHAAIESLSGNELGAALIGIFNREAKELELRLGVTSKNA